MIFSAATALILIIILFQIFENDQQVERVRNNQTDFRYVSSLNQIQLIFLSNSFKTLQGFQVTFQCKTFIVFTFSDLNVTNRDGHGTK